MWLHFWKVVHVQRQTGRRSACSRKRQSARGILVLPPLEVARRLRNIPGIKAACMEIQRFTQSTPTTYHAQVQWVSLLLLGTSNALFNVCTWFLLSQVCLHI